MHAKSLFTLRMLHWHFNAFSSSLKFKQLRGKSLLRTNCVCEKEDFTCILGDFGRFLVFENSEDRFSHDMAHIISLFPCHVKLSFLTLVLMHINRIKQ